MICAGWPSWNSRNWTPYVDVDGSRTVRGEHHHPGTSESEVEGEISKHEHSLMPIIDYEFMDLANHAASVPLHEQFLFFLPSFMFEFDLGISWIHHAFLSQLAENSMAG